MKKRNVLIENGLRVATSLIIGSSLAVIPSCYDDDDIKSSIDSLGDRLNSIENENSIKRIQSNITSLKQLLAALEEDATVTSLIEDEEGNILVVFSNETQALVQLATSSESTHVITETPVITIIEEDGVYYWATYSNGSLVALTSDESKIIASQVVPQVRINSTTGVWEVSCDGKATWISTEIVASDNNPESVILSVEQEDNKVYFNLKGDTKIAIGVDVETEMILAIAGGPQYLDYGQTSIIPIKMQGVYKSAISKPDGWRVSVTSEGLNITAPVQDNPYAEISGVVALTVVSAEGKSLIEEINVKVGNPPVKFSVVDDNITTTKNCLNYCLGISKASEFSIDLVKEILDTDKKYDIMQNQGITIAAADIDPDIVIIPGENYIVWAVPRVSFMGDFDCNEISTVTYMKEPFRSLELSYGEISKLDAVINLTFESCEQYYIGVTADLTNFNKEFILDDIKSGWFENLKMSEPSVMLSTIADKNNVSCIPGRNYLVWAIPVLKKYTEEDIKTLIVTLEAADFNGTATVSVSEIATTMTSYSANITPSADAGSYYYSVFTEDGWPAYSSFEKDADIYDYLMTNGIKVSGSEVTSVMNDYASPDKTYYLCSFAIDANGSYGQLLKQEIVTKGITFEGTASATVTSTPGSRTAEVTFTTSGKVKEYRYLNISQSEFEGWAFDGSVESVKERLVLGTTYLMKTVTPDQLIDNTLKLEDLNLETNYRFFAIVVDENDGIHEVMIDNSYKTNFYSVIRSSSAEYKTPSVTIDPFEIDPEYNSATINYHITPTDDAVKVMYKICDDAELASLPSFKDKINQVVKNGYTVSLSELQNISQYVYLPTNIVVICMKDDNTVYESYIHKIEVPSSAE